MPVPIIYRKGTDPTISLSFTDVASGTGYISLYAGKTSALNLVSSNTFYSQSIFTSATTAATGATKIIDIDFDVVLNNPLILRGKMIANVPFSLLQGNTSYGYIILRLRKVCGGVETEIAVTAASETLGPDATTEIYSVGAVSIDVPLIAFQPGETLRLTAEGWAYNSTSNTTVLKVAHDPKNRSTGWSTAYPTELKVQLPVKLDL